MNNPSPFTHEEAVNIWSWLVSGWANSLDNTGARTRMDGYPNRADVDGSYEGVTRMLWGLGGWLSQSERSPIVTWRGEDFNLVELTKRGIVNGCDPTSPAYWGIDYFPERHHDQRTVETGQIAFALWQSKAQIWDTLSETEQTHIYDFLERFARLPVELNNNWSLFWVLNHTCRKALGLPYEQSVIDDVIGDYLDKVYCGDGWYDDAAEKGTGYFDDYNFWVFGSHVLAWAQVDGHNWPDRRDELLERIRLLMNHMPYLFAANGAYTEFGRSLAYKFARLGAPLWAYHEGVWPHETGMLRRLVGRHLRWYTDRGAIRRDGTLRQNLTAGGSIEIVERYISTGATYWAMQAFGGLWTLPDDDPFWTANEVPLPAETENFTKVYPQPGWVLKANDGEVQRFNAGSVKSYGGTKYAKFVYSTRNPFNVGLPDGFPPPDNMLCLEDYVRPQVSQRSKNMGYTVGDSWLRFKWKQHLNDAVHTVDTAIVIWGNYHIRAHKIEAFSDLNVSTNQLTSSEGSSPLGYQAGETPYIRTNEGYTLAVVGGQMVMIANIQGYSPVRYLYGNRNNVNSIHPFQVLPMLKATINEDGQQLICLVYEGEPIIDVEAEIAKFSGKWLDDGSFEASNGTETMIVPPLA